LLLFAGYRPDSKRRRQTAFFVTRQALKVTEGKAEADRSRHQGAQGKGPVLRGDGFIGFTGWRPAGAIQYQGFPDPIPASRFQEASKIDA
jgi:hypothetical protein